MAYYNIFISHQAPVELQRIAIRANPLQYSRAEQASLLRSARLELLEETDVTEEYRRTQQALYDANLRHEPALRQALGSDMFEERQRNRRRTLRGIDAGVLRRALYVALRPVRKPR